jgi:hypothetical protein
VLLAGTSDKFMEAEYALFPSGRTVALVTAMRLARAHSDELLIARVGWASDVQKKPETVTFASLQVAFYARKGQVRLSCEVENAMQACVAVL